MLIQNVKIGNAAQVPQPVRLASDGGPKAVSTAGVQAAESPQSAASQAAAQQPSPDQLKNAVNVINQVLRQSNHNLQFSVDSDTKKPVVKMIDTETGEMIRQIPSEETLAISRSIDRFQQGVLLRQEA